MDTVPPTPTPIETHLKTVGEVLNGVMETLGRVMVETGLSEEQVAELERLQAQAAQLDQQRTAHLGQQHDRAASSFERRFRRY